MTTDLIALPLTGEAIELSAATDVLAQDFDRVAELERELRAVRNRIKDELLARMDENLARKHEAGPWVLECEAPNQVDYSPDELSPVLMRLVAEGKITEQAMGDVLRRDVTYKPVKRALDKLLTLLDPEDRAAVVGCAKPRTRERRLTVKRG